MDRLDIEIFITIINEKNMLKAADTLYLAPSTIGARLRSLEQELGVPLIERKKGIKTVTLTRYGEEFSKIAHNFLSLWNECDNLKTNLGNTSLTIGTADAFLEHNFVPLYRNMVYGSSKFNLDIRRYPSDMIYPLVSKKEVDVGFALYHVKYTDVVVQPLFSDDVVVIIPQDSPITGTTIHPDDLDPEKELFIGSNKNLNVGWGPVFYGWHDQWFNVEKKPLFTANSLSVLAHFLGHGDYWTFLPRLAAIGYKRELPIRILELAVPAPSRTCYMLTHESPSDSVKYNCDNFRKLLIDYLSCFTEINMHI